MTKSIYNILGITIKLNTNCNRFNNFVKYSIEEIKNVNESLFNIDLTINFNKSIFEKKKNISLIRKKNSEYFGSEIYWDSTNLFWDTKKLSVLITQYDKKYLIKAFASLRFDQKIRKFFNHNSEFENNFFLYVYRFAILYPAFSIFSNQKKYSVIHASAIYDEIKKEAILFVGLNGVGKSSLAFKLQQMERFTFLSDNFVLVDGTSVFPVPELLRLPKDLILDYEQFQVISKANNKYLLKNNYAINKTNSYDIGKIIFVSRGIDGGSSSLKLLTNEIAFNLLSNIGSYLKEYENFHYTAFLERQKVINDVKNYNTLTKNSKSYIYRIGVSHRPRASCPRVKIF